ncbi:MAG TPA: fibronectin type III-like domain-contianing protein, partial [Candidatus Methylomirabilis sp.]|nr:fibronectin type III-like domain-contianing protein [Candidatus Methylomirabilis sp.]
LFPFGYGLSYTTFSITNPELIVNTGSSQGVQVSFQLQNTGTRSGSEVAQVYLELPTSTSEVRRLVGWQKVFLNPGQQQAITVQVNAADSSHPLSYWDTGLHAWQIASGTYKMYLGNSSANALAIGTFQMP